MTAPTSFWSLQTGVVEVASFASRPIPAQRRRAPARLAPPGVLLAAALAACTVGPDYEQPDYSVPDQWQAAIIEEMGTDTTESTLEMWWTAFGDTTLTSLIRRSELANLDLAAAVARVAEARAIRGIAVGGLLPDISLDAAYSRTKLSENGFQGQQIGGDGAALLKDPFNTWTMGLSLSWEIDVFGKIRRQVESATAGMEASVEDYRDVLVTLYAEVATSYVDVRAFQTRLVFARSNAQSQRESVQLTRDRYRAGLTSALDVAQAESNLASTESEIPTLEIGLIVSLNRLAILLGQAPGTLNEELLVDAEVPPDPAGVAAGIPADLLRRRPDIRRAERELAQATALIGVAVAELYPSFSLTGFLGLESIDLTDLGDGGSLGWGIVPGMKWNLFAGGKIRNRIRVEEARTQQALIAYEQAILDALEEVTDAMVAYERERQRRDRLQEAADASQRSVDLVRTQYVSGLTNFQNVLDSQRSLFRQQDQLADSEGRVIKNLVDLNRALGGGWSLDAISQDSVLAQASEQAEAGPPLPPGAATDFEGDD